MEDLCLQDLNNWNKYAANWDKCYAENSTVSILPLLRYETNAMNTIPRELLATFDWTKIFSRVVAVTNSKRIGWRYDKNSESAPLVNEIAKKIRAEMKYPIGKCRELIYKAVNDASSFYWATTKCETIQLAKRRYQAEIRMIKRVFPFQDRDCLGLICEYAYGELGSAIYDPTPAVVYTGRKLKIKKKLVVVGEW